MKLQAFVLYSVPDKTKIMNNINKTRFVKRIAILSDDKTRKDLIEWSYSNKQILRQHELIAAKETAEILEGTLNTEVNKLDLVPGAFHSRLADMIRQGALDIIIVLGDTGSANILESSTQQLLQLAIDKGIATACGRATAELVTAALQRPEKSQSPYHKVVEMIRHNIHTMKHNRRRSLWAAG